ncbi:hypothetical protein M422DRAFT_56755 [Sphaerobolus stellatus SS14]|uniref:Vacuolar calcium ion transporter n=1 Tax=Sphaerobolus stellatus (strain SS14) TaxID=990650 RepID=A0A0C9UEL0_SPHS4|nr:hypothetical protein M422DRAFT_56755 [Sphaerobolus stellatus SS14]
MGQSSGSSTPNVANNALFQPAPTLGVVTEDDDEPPSSGFDQKSLQVNIEPTNSPNSIQPGGTVSDTMKGASFSRDKGINSLDEKSTPVTTDLFERNDTLVASDVQSRSYAESVRQGASRLRVLFNSQKELGPSPTYKRSIQETVRYTPLNILLLFIPVSWALHYTHQSPTLIFVFSCLAIIPLAALLGLGTEQIALRTSQSVGGLLNATLGNVIELIIAGVALKQCELELVQSSLLGGLLSNLLLVLGMAFIVGGSRFKQQEFQPMVAQLNSSLLMVSILSLIMPVAFHEYLQGRLTSANELSILLQFSRGSAVILIFIYFAYFYSHSHLFLDTPQTSHSVFHRQPASSVETLPLPNTASSSLLSSTTEHERPRLNVPFALFLLIAITALAFVTAENLVESLQGLVSAHPGVSKEWITLIVIPIVSNAAEHTTAVVMARKGKFDLAMSVAVGSCIQIALFVIPLLLLVAWGLGKPLTLLFDPLETVILFFSVLLVKYSTEGGKSHWMNGVGLIAAYILIALLFWNFPETHRLLQGQPIQCF